MITEIGIVTTADRGIVIAGIGIVIAEIAAS